MSELPIRIKNYRLAREVLQRILQESATYTQERWTYRCNSPACMAAHVVVATLRDGETLQFNAVFGPDDSFVAEIAHRARDMLGLDDPFMSLFQASVWSTWPAPYGERYENAPTPEARAKVAADLLERLADEAEERERREA